MKPRMSEAVTEYKARGWGDKYARMHMNDVFEIMDLSKRDPVQAIILALEGAYMIGYKAGASSQNLYDYSKLRSLIKEKYGTIKAFADALGIHPTTLSGRLNNRLYWPQCDIDKACLLLGIHNPQTYFYAKNPLYI